MCWEECDRLNIPRTLTPRMQKIQDEKLAAAAKPDPDDKRGTAPNGNRTNSVCGFYPDGKCRKMENCERLHIEGPGSQKKRPDGHKVAPMASVPDAVAAPVVPVGQLYGPPNGHGGFTYAQHPQAGNMQMQQQQQAAALIDPNKLCVSFSLKSI